MSLNCLFLLFSKSAEWRRTAELAVSIKNGLVVCFKRSIFEKKIEKLSKNFATKEFACKMSSSMNFHFAWQRHFRGCRSNRTKNYLRAWQPFTISHFNSTENSKEKSGIHLKNLLKINKCYIISCRTFTLKKSDVKLSI